MSSLGIPQLLAGLARVLRSTAFRLSTSAVLIAVLIYLMDSRQALSAIQDATPALLALSLAVILCNRVLVPLKWNLLLRARGNYLPWFASIRIYFISSFLGFFLPATVGADAVRTYLTNADRIDVKETLASIIVERILGLIGLILFMLSSVGLLIYLVDDGTFNTTAALIYGAVALTVATGAFLLSFSAPFLRLAEAVLARLRKLPRLKKLAGTLEQLLHAYAGYRHHKMTMLLFFGLTIVEMSLVVVRCHLAARALHMDVTLGYFFAFVPIVLFFSRLPLSVDGFGIHEGLYVYFLALAGVDATVAFTIGLLNHLLAITGMLPGGVLYAFHRPVVDQIRRQSQQATLPVEPVPAKAARQSGQQ